jgi:hypothetical protein
MSKFDTSDKKIMKTIFFKMLHQPHLTPMQTAGAIAKLKENWSLAAVARELHCSKTCIFNAYKEGLARKQA